MGTEGQLPCGGGSSLLRVSTSLAGFRAHQTGGAQLWSPALDLVPGMISWPGSGGQNPAERKCWPCLSWLRYLDPSPSCWLKGWGGPPVADSFGDQDWTQVPPADLPWLLLGSLTLRCSEVWPQAHCQAHQVGQAQVTHDGHEDAHAGRDEVPQGRGLGIHVTCAETPAAKGRWLVPLAPTELITLVPRCIITFSGEPPGLFLTNSGGLCRAPAQPCTSLFVPYVPFF